MSHIDSHQPEAVVDDRSPEAEGLLERYGMLLVLAASLIAMLGSLFFSGVMHFEPCRLCWYQRILMYPIVAIALVGILRADRGAALYILPLSLIGIFTSSYHVLLQHGFFSESKACLRGVPCSGRYINWLGFVSIPVLALTAFLIISFAGSAALRSRPESLAFGQRAGRAAALIAIIAAIFGILYIQQG